MLKPPRATGDEINERGFVTIADVFGPREIDGISDALARAPLARSRAGARHAMRSPTVARLAQDTRLATFARGVLGEGALPYRATLFDKSPDSNWLVVWHQDTALPLRRRADMPGWGPWSVKAGVIYAHAPAVALERILALRIHLDDSTELNGPLRVIPGTHRQGVMTDSAIHALAQEHAGVDCLVPRGGILAMRPLLVHASSKSLIDTPRRVLHVEYAESMEIAPGLALTIA